MTVNYPSTTVALASDSITREHQRRAGDTHGGPLAFANAAGGFLLLPFNTPNRVGQNHRLSCRRRRFDTLIADILCRLYRPSQPSRCQLFSYKFLPIYFFLILVEEFAECGWRRYRRGINDDIGGESNIYGLLTDDDRLIRSAVVNSKTRRREDEIQDVFQVSHQSRNGSQSVEPTGSKENRVINTKSKWWQSNIANFGVGTKKYCCCAELTFVRSRRVCSNDRRRPTFGRTGCPRCR